MLWLLISCTVVGTLTAPFISRTRITLIIIVIYVVQFNSFRGSIDTMNPIVHLTDSASVRGKFTGAIGADDPVEAFLGIPYAQPPVGELRFLPPKPVQLWDGTRNCSEFGEMSVQWFHLNCLVFLLWVGEVFLEVRVYSGRTRQRQIDGVSIV